MSRPNLFAKIAFHGEKIENNHITKQTAMVHIAGDFISFAAMRILMVCLGNICLSPIAEGIMRHKIKQHGLIWTVESAGTESYHIGEAPHHFSQKICREHGIDISEFRASKFTTDAFILYDKIYAMAGDVYQEIKYIGGKKADMHKVDYFLNELHKGSNESVPDPWYGPEEGYKAVYEMIDKTCEAIIKNRKEIYV